MERELVEATWGLVAATSLLFLASVVPAVKELLNWSNSKKALASDLIPTLHAIRMNMTEVRANLLALTLPLASEDIDSIYTDVHNMLRPIHKIQNHEGLSLDQRLEMDVLVSHIEYLSARLSGVCSFDDPDVEYVLSENQRFQQCIVYCEAALLSFDRLDHLFVGVRKRYRGHTFTEEISLRKAQDCTEAAERFADISREPAQVQADPHHHRSHAPADARSLPQSRRSAPAAEPGPGTRLLRHWRVILRQNGTGQ